MPAIALVGAGARLGLSVAKVFGRHGFDVALIARGEENLGALTAKLETDGVRAAGFPADVMDRPALAAALDRAAGHFGGIDVLQYSTTPATPRTGTGFVAPLDVTVENLAPQFESVCYGAVTATRAVLPAMLAAGAGTLLFTTGASSVTPRAAFGNVGPAVAALRNWALNLHTVLAERGVYAGHVAIGYWIGDTPGAPAGAPRMEPDEIAPVYWDLHTARTHAERVIVPSA